MSLNAVVTAGSCDVASLIALLLGATATALLLVRLPGPALLTFLPALLLPAWLACGSFATVAIAIVASLASAAWRTRHTELTLLHGAVTLAAVLLGALAGAAASAALSAIADGPFQDLLAGATFLTAYSLGEAAAIEVVRRQTVRRLAANLPRSNLVANLLLLFPGYVLTNILLARGPVYFVPMLLVSVVVLGLIALYMGATTAREAIVYERARAVAAATGGVNVPPELLEDRAMELTHELRSPLTAILGYAGLLSRTAGRDRAREDEYVASIAASSSYMLRLVNNILDLQRLESGTQPIQLRPVPMERLLAEALAGIQPRADEKGVSTVLAVEPGLPPLITDELLLRRALDNLLSNAVKYTRPGDQIRLSAERDGARMAISVADTGIGLTQEERARLFERFFRSRRSEARVERGTGLGLAIVREAVTRLEGEVRVDSALGEGSTFTLWLPLPSSELSTPSPASGR